MLPAFAGLNTGRGVWDWAGAFGHLHNCPNGRDTRSWLDEWGGGLGGWGRVHKSKRTVTLAIYQPMINVVLFHCNTRTAREGLALLVGCGRRGGASEAGEAQPSAAHSNWMFFAFPFIFAVIIIISLVSYSVSSE